MQVEENSMQLSKNFSLSEFTKSSTAVRLEIENIPTKRHIENMKYLCEKITQPARDHFGSINISSGYRSKELCLAIGSSVTSFHAIGCADDSEVKAPEVSNFEYLLWIYENCDFTELIAEYFDEDDNKAGWVHSAIQKGRENERTLKLKDKDHNYEVVTIEYLKELYLK